MIITNNIEHSSKQICDTVQDHLSNEYKYWGNEVWVLRSEVDQQLVRYWEEKEFLQKEIHGGPLKIDTTFYIIKIFRLMFWTLEFILERVRTKQSIKCIIFIQSVTETIDLCVNTIILLCSAYLYMRFVNFSALCIIKSKMISLEIQISFSNQNEWELLSG